MDTSFVAGYSKTPLPKKLGIKEDLRLAVLGAPARFIADGIGPLPARATLTERLDGPTDLAITFVTELTDLASQLDGLEAATRPDGAFWVCWPKRASKVPTDITEDRIRDLVLPRGTVDVKVCAIDQTWSGLKLCQRRELRGR